MNRLFIMLNLGLGDAILSNGLVRTKAIEYDEVCLPCYAHNLPSVAFMFSDVPNITLQPIDDAKYIFDLEKHHQHNKNDILRLGFYSGEAHVEPETFDQTLYRQAGVEFSKRWDSFKLPEIRVMYQPPDEPHAMICDDPSRGFNINGNLISNSLPRFAFPRCPTIFDLTEYILKATELHCINSAPAILADSIPTNGKLFMHRYARPCTAYDNFKLRKNWTVLT